MKTEGRREREWKPSDTLMLSMLGVLLAMEVVLTRFLSINAWNIRIGFGFVPVVVAGMLFGPLPAGVVAGLGDLLGAVLFPTGPYFPGFTLTAVLTGLVFGLFLRRRANLLRIAAAVFIVQFVLGLLCNTYWIHVLYQSPFLPLLATRAVQAAFLSAVQIATIHALSRLSDRLWKWVTA